MVRVLLMSLLMTSVTAHAQSEEPSRRVIRKVARTYACDRDAVNLTHLLTERIGRRDVIGWTVTGCGDTFAVATSRYRGITQVLASDAPVRTRAPVDLECGADGVTYRYVDHTTRAARGCGRQVTYVVGPDWQWVADLASSSRGIEGGTFVE